MKFVYARYVLITTLLHALLAGCSGRNISETELPITPTESIASFSRSSQSEISSLSIAPDQLGDPSALESSALLATLTPAGRRSLLVSEAWQLRAQNDVEVPIATSLDRYLRAAHFAYEGIFAGEACSETPSQLCSDLYTAYNRATREIARLTNNGRDLVSAKSLRYVLDSEGDGDPLTLGEWELTLDDYSPIHMKPAFGAGGAACQTVRIEGSAQERAARQCAPIAFTVLFDARTEDSRSRAHLVAYDTFEHDTLSLHGDEITLQSNALTAWNQIFAPTTSPSAALSCFSTVAPSLPTVILMTNTPDGSSEWSLIGAALTGEKNLADHFNFCAFTSVPPNGAEPPSNSLATLLRLLAPNASPPLQVILVSDGGDNDPFIRSLKQSLKENRQGHATSGEQHFLTLAGSLALIPARPGNNSASTLQAISVSELSRRGTVALHDIKRLLTKLADSDNGIFGGLSRSPSPHEPNELLSPVM